MKKKEVPKTKFGPTFFGTSSIMMDVREGSENHFHTSHIPFRVYNVKTSFITVGSVSNVNAHGINPNLSGVNCVRTSEYPKQISHRDRTPYFISSYCLQH